MRTLLTQTFCLMCYTQYLELNNNKISDTGMTAFADAVGKGALASLKDLYLFQDAPALKAVCQARGIRFH